MLTGSCLCRSVRFEVEGPFGAVYLCHCESCRKAQGTPFGSNSPISRKQVRLLTGEEYIAEFESSPGKKRCFCRNCGSPLWSRRDADPDTLRLRLGLLDGDPGVRPIAHVWVGEKAPWYDIDDDLPQAGGDGAELRSRLNRP